MRTARSPIPPRSARPAGRRRLTRRLPCRELWLDKFDVTLLRKRADQPEKSPVQGYLAALTIVLLVGMVLTLVILMRRTGIRAVHFGRIDRTDFLIPPFALFYFYTVFAGAFDLPTVSTQRFFHSEVMAWVGVFLCFAGLILFLLSLVSFGKSFRVGIDIGHRGKMVTTGVLQFGS